MFHILSFVCILKHNNTTIQMIKKITKNKLIYKIKLQFYKSSHIIMINLSTIFFPIKTKKHKSNNYKTHK